MDPDRSTIAVSPPTGLYADGVERAEVTVVVRNVLGNPVADAAVEFIAGGAGAVIDDPVLRTDAAGMATAHLSATVPGPKTVAVQVGGEESAVLIPSVNGGTFIEEFNDVNVIVILLDDVGTDFLSMFDEANPYQADLPYQHGVVGSGDAPGNGPGTSNLYINAPNMQAMADDGVTFLNAYAMPMCSPTRATLLTGNYPIRHGVGHIMDIDYAFGDMREFGDPGFEFTTLTEIVQGAGFADGLFGKWHLGLQTEEMDPQEGDDLHLGWASIPERGHFSEFRCVFNGVNVAPTPPSGGNYYDYIFNRNYTDHADVIADPTSFETEYATVVQFDEALEWCNQQTDPFFCFIPPNAVHSPWNLLPPGELTTTDEYVNGPVNAFTRYLAAFEATDAMIGELVNGLIPSIRENTLFIVMGDNGSEPITMEHARANGQVTGGGMGSAKDLGATYDLQIDDPVGRFKRSCYEKGTRVPLIVSGFGVLNPGRTSRALVDCADIFSTIVDVIGQDSPDVHGISFVPVLRDQADYLTHARDYTYTELFAPIGSTGPGVIHTTRKVGCSVRIPGEGRYKIVREFGTTDKLYKLQDENGDYVDPFETNPLDYDVNDPERPNYNIVLSKILEIFASGDNTGPDCDQINFCESFPNSTGIPATIFSNGRCSVSQNEFSLAATPVPNQFGLFFYASDVFNGGAGVPFGNGLLCAGGSSTIQRLPVTQAFKFALRWQVDFTDPPTVGGQIAAGSTWNFQAWFRDPLAGGAPFDLSDGLTVTFQP